MLREDLQEDIKIGVVGTGRIAERFVPESEYVSYVKATCVYDIDYPKACDFAVRHNIVNVCQSYEELLGQVDAVYIATPHLSHYELTKQALLQKKHVLCETPLVLNGQQAKELYHLAVTHH